MRAFSMTSLAHRTTTVTNAADRESVALTHHGKEKYILMRIEEYEKLTRRAFDPRHAGFTTEMPAMLQDMFFDGIRARASEQPDIVNGDVPYDPAHRIDVLSNEKNCDR